LSSLATQAANTTGKSPSSASSQLVNQSIRPSIFQQQPSISLNRFYSEPHDTNYSIQPHAVLNNNYLMNTPCLEEIDLVKFMQGTYYDKWLKQGKQISDAAINTSDRDDIEVMEMKAKYFAAWRKYTLKKRKQNALMMANCKF